MSNIGIAVRSGSFLRIVCGNKLACQDSGQAHNLQVSARLAF
jgi:hypothetical protein